MNRKNFVLLLVFTLLLDGLPQVKLPSVISSNMVLQQNSIVKFWGWASPGENIIIKGSWLESDITLKADENGSWVTKIKTEKAGGPYNITFTGKNTIELKNILFGEVWFCSGQSNMEWPLSKADNAELEISNADYPEIRLFNVKNDVADLPQNDCETTLLWSECSPDTVKNFSAVAYFFARELYKELNIPVGLIESDWGGSSAQVWTKSEVLKSDKILKKFSEKPFNPSYVHHQPSGLYNAMIHPLINYAIKGVIWYQGEANRNEADIYKLLFPSMIKNWRDDWGYGDFPFYFVQIAPFNYNEPVVGALLREAQFESMSVPNTGMVVTMDIGNVNDIHPTNKQDIGKRLALWALAKTYNKKNLVYSGPVYRSMKKEGNKIRLYFDNTGSGLVLNRTEPNNFMISGEDEQFFEGDAYVDGNTVVISSDEVKRPAAVRYAFTNISEATLFNKEGLPASSFRTDNWPVITQGVNINPVFDSGTKKIFIEMKCDNEDADIHYTLDGTDPVKDSPLYKGEFLLEKSAEIRARVFKKERGSSAISKLTFLKHLAMGKEVKLSNPVSPRYMGKRNITVVDGIKGSLNFRDGNWLGFEGDDFIAEIDLGKMEEIKSIYANFLQNSGSWIFMPEYVEFFISEDGNKFSFASKVKNDISQKEKGALTGELSTHTMGVTCRFIRIRAKNIGICPDWHPGAGGKAWLFIDEIIVK